ncbi:HAD family hydrolase [Candidatus Woesearchaeota archaeon]|nr:HAD family hydrolase [Candidatus Woesearchaeota archaeon]
MNNKKATKAVRRTIEMHSISEVPKTKVFVTSGTGASSASASPRSVAQGKEKGSSKSKIKAIVFDFDGVVVDTLPRALEVWGRAFKEFRITHVTLNKDFFESDYRAMAERLNISKHNLGKLEKLYYDARTPVSLFEGIKPIITKLSKEYKLALVSNSPPVRFRKRVKSFKIEHYFQAIIGITNGIRMKPHPDMLLLALKRLHVKPDEAIYIGDMEGDILASKAAEVMVIGATYGFHTHIRLKGADVIVDSPKEIIPAIKRIEKGL